MSSKRKRKSQNTESKKKPAKKQKKNEPVPDKFSPTEYFDWDEEENLPNFNCNQIRRKINAFHKRREMTLTKWLREIGGVNSNSYYRFMKQSGEAAGVDNSTYLAALRFFKKYDVEKKKKKKTDKGVPAGEKKKKRKSRTEQDEELQAILDVELTEFETSAIFSSCTEVRRRIKQYLLSHEINVTAFCDALKVNSNAYRRFMNVLGLYEGSPNQIFARAYDFFEKFDKRSEKKKNKERLKAELAHKRTKPKSYYHRPTQIKRGATQWTWCRPGVHRVLNRSTWEYEVVRR